MTSNLLLNQILAEISPEYVEAAAVEATLGRWQTNPLLLKIPETIDLVWEAALNSQEPTEDFIAGIGHNQAALAGWNHWRTAVAAARQTASTKQADIIGRETDQILARLAAMLTGLISRVRELEPQLGGARSAEAAIRGGRGATDAWAQLSDSTAEYDAIRAAQRDLLILIPHGLDRAAIHELNTARLAAGQFRDHIQVEPYWCQRRKALRSGLTKLGHYATNAPEGPKLIEWANRPVQPLSGSCVQSHSWWPTSDHGAALLEIVTQTNPWIPGVAEMLDAADLATTATTVPDSGGNRGGIDGGTARAFAALKQHATLTKTDLDRDSARADR